MVYSYARAWQVDRAGTVLVPTSFAKLTSEGGLANDGLPYGICRDFHVRGNCSRRNCHHQHALNLEKCALVTRGQLFENQKEFLKQPKGGKGKGK